MTTKLVKQDSPKPTRKMAAVIIATFLVQGAVGVAEAYYPGIERALPANEWIAALVPLIAGYLVREKVNADA